ncbi:hypothetical protein [Pseudoroseicyclus tamaricis]|uniref:Response regulatory domain-containing protein n=2 Tax=Pseudoroseicyclus tamaricis TaxID=2705421 RepID=A0A6B2JT85_9RHOB|nr:hypothetical protein [Pseudoroseicyclus tamaricis]NDV01458.1 hypothetical protein [Pseudoroseicyclus tamaricis]
MVIIGCEPLVAADVEENLAARFPDLTVRSDLSFSDVWNAVSEGSVPTIVIIGHKLKGMEPVEVAGRFAEHQCAIVILEVEDEAPLSFEARQAQRWAVLPLPFSDSGLNRAVDEALGRQRFRFSA